jgi:hypothetical protein
MFTSTIMYMRMVLRDLICASQVSIKKNVYEECSERFKGLFGCEMRLGMDNKSELIFTI